jgi:hypothetical protein
MEASSAPKLRMRIQAVCKAKELANRYRHDCSNLRGRDQSKLVREQNRRGISDSIGVRRERA